jgi:transcriptional regulator
MYIPPHFREDDPGEIARFIRENSFGLLVSQENGLPVATHIPMELEGQPGDHMVIRGHIARGNPQWRTLDPDTPALAVFSGPHAYISSSWYSQPNVPTWNYMAVHVYGRPRILTEAELRSALQNMTDTYEQGSAQPFHMDQLPPETIDRMLKGIVGFELAVECVEAKYKLSQNRDAESYHNVIEALQNREDPAGKAIAEEMKKRR